jgi:hypothetical protein
MIYPTPKEYLVKVTSKDNAEGLAIAWFMDSETKDMQWLVIGLDTGEPWWVPNYEIRFHPNWTYGSNR